MSATTIGHVIRGAALGALVLLATSAGAAHAAYVTWNFTGELDGNTLQPEPILIDGLPPDPNTNPMPQSLIDAGIAPGVPFSATFSFDPNEPDLLDILDPNNPDPDVGYYLTGAFDWKLGDPNGDHLSARTAHVNQAITIVNDVDISDPNDPPFIVDVTIMQGGGPPVWNGGTLEIITAPADPNIPGDLPTAPTIILTHFNVAYSDDALPTSLPFIIDKGFGLGLRDTSDPNTVIELNGSITGSTGAGTPTDCTGVGSADADGDLICDDVDICLNTPDIDQADADFNGIGNACNDADDPDGDEWENANDNCPTVSNFWQEDEGEVDKGRTADGVGDACDNCTERNNPPQGDAWYEARPWAHNTGGQRDDDMDGYGNKCDGKFTAGLLVGPADTSYLLTGIGELVSTSQCGTTGDQPCAPLDVDEAAMLVGPTDTSYLLNELLGKLVGPKCDACPLPEE